MHEVLKEKFPDADEEIQEAAEGSRSYTGIAHIGEPHPCFGNRVTHGIFGLPKLSKGLPKPSKERSQKGKSRETRTDAKEDEALKFYGLECFSTCPGAPGSVVEGPSTDPFPPLGPLPASPPLSPMDVVGERTPPASGSAMPGSASLPSPDTVPRELPVIPGQPISLGETQTTVPRKRKTDGKRSRKISKRQRSETANVHTDVPSSTNRYAEVAAIAGIGSVHETPVEPLIPIPEPSRADRSLVVEWSRMVASVQFELDAGAAKFSGPDPAAIASNILQKMLADADISPLQPSPFAYVSDPEVHIPNGNLVHSLLNSRTEFKLYVLLIRRTTTRANTLSSSLRVIPTIVNQPSGYAVAASVFEALLRMVVSDTVAWMPCGPFKTVMPFNQGQEQLTKVFVYGQLVACYIFKLQRWPEGVSPLTIGQLCCNANSAFGPFGETHLPLEYIHKFFRVAGELLWPWFETVKRSGSGPLADVPRSDPLRSMTEHCLSTFKNTTVSASQSNTSHRL